MECPFGFGLVRIATTLSLIFCLCGPVSGAQAQEQDERPLRSRLSERTMPQMEPLLSGVSCTNGAGHRIADWGIAPRLYVSRRGRVIFRWLEYGSGGRGTGWTVMYASAQLEELSLTDIRSDLTVGTCPVVELFCKEDECVTVRIGWGEKVPDTRRNDFLIYLRDAAQAEQVISALRAGLRD